MPTTAIPSTLAYYLPPTAREVPAIELHHLDTPSVNSITKAKGLSQGGTIGARAAVINAINDALSPFGVVIDEMPATSQRIREASRAAEKAVWTKRRSSCCISTAANAPSRSSHGTR